MPQQAAARTVARFLVIQIVVLGALVAAVWQVGSQNRKDIRASTVTIVHRQVVSSRAGCARSTADRFDAINTNLDLAAFALSAAQARRASGDVGIARQYAAEAERAKKRVTSILRRVPAKGDDASIRRFCARAFPFPAGT
jgi:hypothetical protein